MINNARRLLQSYFLTLITLSFLGACSKAPANIDAENAEQDKNFEQKVVINELMASNHTGIMTKDGEMHDWIELKNVTSKKVSLEGYTLVVTKGNEEAATTSANVKEVNNNDADAKKDKKKNKKSEKGDNSLTDKAKNLFTQTQSDTTTNGDKYWVIPDITLNPGECRVIFASKKKSSEKADELHASLKLSSKGGIVKLLSSHGTVMSEMKYKSLNRDQVMRRLEDGTKEKSYVQTPGFDNNEEGYEAFNNYIESQRKSPIRIWRVKAISTKKSNNWVKLRNVSDQTVDLSDYYLTDNIDKPKKWQLKGHKLEPDEEITIEFAGKGVKGEPNNKAKFKLDDDKTVVLTNKGHFADGLCAKLAYFGLHMGRTEGRNGFYYFPTNDVELDKATDKKGGKAVKKAGKKKDGKKKSNKKAGKGDKGKAKKPAAVNSVVKNDSAQTAENPLADNSKKQQEGKKESGKAGKKEGGKKEGGNKTNKPATATNNKPVAVSNEKCYRFVAEKPKFIEKPGTFAKGNSMVIKLNTHGHKVYYTTDGSEPNTNSKLYEDSIVITKTTPIRAIAMGDSSSVKSRVTTGTFFIGPKHTLPIISISVAHDDLYDFHKGIYVKGPGAAAAFPHKGANFWKSWERKAHVAFYDGKEGFEKDCGLMIFGGFSRANDKKSFKIKFRDKYGSSKVSYDYFNDGEEEELKTFVLRSGSQDDNRVMIRDEFFTSLLAANSPTLLVQAYRPVAVYINGEYFGLYYIREKIDKDFVARHLNVSNDSISIVMSKYLEEGSIAHLRKMQHFVRTNDMSKKENYEYFCQNVDCEGLIDLQLGQMYTQNTDIGNVRYVRSTSPESDKKWHWVFYDLDATWGDPRTAGFYLNPESDLCMQNVLINRALKNKEFRKLFLQRLSMHLHKTFSEANANAVYDKLINTIRPEMKRNCERWPKLTYEKWEQNVVNFRDKFKTKNKSLLNDLRKAISITAEEEKLYFSDLGY